MLYSQPATSNGVVSGSRYRGVARISNPSAHDGVLGTQRLLIAGQALTLGKVLSRTVRKFLNEQELLFPAPPMKPSGRERDILTLAAAGRASKEIAAMVGVDMHVGPILSKMGALNRNQAIAKAITNKLIDVDDDGHAEYMSAKLNATRKKSVPIARSAAGTDRSEAR